MDVILVIIAVFFSLAFHETAHGLVAYALGDPTAKMEGRLSLNPIRHIDAFGTILLPLLLIFAGMPVFGWAKPVRVDYRNFKNPVRDGGLTALAGPVSNIVLALCAAFLLTYTRTFMPELILRFLWIFFYLNIALGIFNFLPLAPLDGSKIIGLIVPKRFHDAFLKFLDRSTTYFLILLVFDIYVMPLLVGYSVFGRLMGIVMDYIQFLIFSST